MLVLAIDNQVSLGVVDQLRQHYEIAIWAGKMSDEEWVDEAMCRGANVFISPDLDIPNLLDKWFPEAKWIDVPQNMPRHKQFSYLMGQLKRIKV